MTAAVHGKNHLDTIAFPTDPNVLHIVPAIMPRTVTGCFPRLHTIERLADVRRVYATMVTLNAKSLPSLEVL